ncbi:MAG: 16S rRNA (cytosine(1402)-N(4))-methyltransferase RsmH [Gemmatimonadetes bacterium]|nr:16S rRNA (cytosine(1402)-N(4))-methyltransferase RsmH [Gemmatimonadota bacterium]
MRFPPPEARIVTPPAVPFAHQPVLAAEIAERARGARRVVDATLGGGGHASLFWAAGAAVLGIDRDPRAIAAARARLGEEGITYLEAPYASDAALEAIGRFAPDVILLDLGVSSPQLDDEARGFTFRPGAPLDMRMGDDAATAADLLNTADAEELRRIFREYGDERQAGRLAREIVRRRGTAPFATSDELVNAIRAVLGPRSGPPDFARLFQAVRIAVNDELGGLARALPAMRDALVPGGRIAVISYHSGEDRIVKHSFQEWARTCVCPVEQPVCTCRGRPLGRLEPRKPVYPSDAEAQHNPRARSATLRTFRTIEV